ncbi:MAG: hypothetical protein MI723_11830, partial [Caulobacterales bacterium]|nr:hypothetical protein [Caulobacterales bacterium]
GSIITALSHSKPIVIMPRTAARRETRNDHQVATAQRLGQRPGIYVADDEAALPDALDQVLTGAGAGPATPTISSFAEPRLLRDIRNFILHGAETSSDRLKSRCESFDAPARSAPNET